MQTKLTLDNELTGVFLVCVYFTFIYLLCVCICHCPSVEAKEQHAEVSSVSTLWAPWWSGLVAGVFPHMYIYVPHAVDKVASRSVGAGN